MFKTAIASVCLLFLSLGVFWAQEKQPQKSGQAGSTAAPTAEAAPPPTWNISAEEKARKNPEKFTAESVDKGKAVYQTQCAMCHGTSGDGKGDLAGIMHLNLPDMKNPATLEKLTDGELFAMINSGLGPMPGEAHRMLPNTVWNIVNFLRSVEGKTPEKPRKHLSESNREAGAQTVEPAQP